MRLWHRLYALVGGYFWIDCERCGKGWGGQEWRHAAQTRPTGESGGVAAYCPRCVAPERRNLVTGGFGG